VQLSARSSSTDWPQFRGVNRDGVSAEKGLLDAWPESGPKEVWRVALGDGYSGISIVADRLYTMYSAESDGEATEFAAAFDVETGKELWRTAVGKTYVNMFGDGPRSTPTVDGEQVFVLGSYGDLAALSTADGSEQWTVSLTESFDSKVPTFGFSTSTLVDGGQLIVEGGGKEGNSYVALDKKTGEVRWTFGDGPDEPSYNSALLFKTADQTCYVYIVGDKLRCVDKSGSEIWSHPWTVPGETHAMPVFVAPNRIFASGAEGVGATMFEINGKSEVEELWKSRFMRNHFSSSVHRGAHIYGFDNATLRTISVEDGETAWAKRGFGKGSLIAADGHLLVLSDQGRLVLVEATPDEYRESGSVQALEGRCWTAPTLANGMLYLRNHEEMVRYDLRQ
jgi:outer membrane protein assembly factor BamB